MTQSDKKEEKNKETQKAEPASEKEKKLNRKVADKLKFYGVVTFLSLLCAGFIWFIFKPDTPETVEGTAGINTTIPDAIAPETMADKQKAYELEEMKKRRQEKVRTLQDMAGGYLTPDTTDGLKPEEDVPKADAIRESREKQRQISRQITSFYQEPKENPRVDELERQVKELNEKLEREQKGQDPLELMENRMRWRHAISRTDGRTGEEHTACGRFIRQSCRHSCRTCHGECGFVTGRTSGTRHDPPQLRFCHCRGRRTACRSQYDTCLRGRRPDSDHRSMTEVPVAGTTASGRCACTCQYSAIWYGAYRRTTDGSHSKLHRERREYPAGGTNGLRYGRAGRTFRSEYRRTYRHERSRRQYRGQFRNKHLVRTQCLATTRHGRDKGRAWRRITISGHKDA